MTDTAIRVENLGKQYKLGPVDTAARKTAAPQWLLHSGCSTVAPFGRAGIDGSV